MPNPQSVPEFLEAWLGVLRKRGWCKGHLFNTQGASCVSGAFLRVPVEDETDGRIGTIANAAWLHVYQAVPPVRGVRHGISGFNDSPYTTFKDIEDLFTKAIEEAQSANRS